MTHDVTKTPRLRALQATLIQRRSELEPLTDGISKLRATLEETEVELAQIGRGIVDARSKAAAELTARLLTGGKIDFKLTDDEEVGLARVAAESKRLMLQESLTLLSASEAAKRAEIAKSAGAIDTEINVILTASLEAQAAKVDRLRGQYIAEGLILGELLGDELRSPISAAPRGSEAVRRILSALPKPDDLHVKADVLRRGHSNLRDRWAEMRVQLLGDGQTADSQESAAA